MERWIDRQKDVRIDICMYPTDKQFYLFGSDFIYSGREVLEIQVKNREIYSCLFGDVHDSF